jgi:hypothetical protein
MTADLTAHPPLKFQSTKKTGPLRARSEFASVGAPAITFLEGKKLPTRVADLGGSLATTRQQQTTTMQTVCAMHNMAMGMPAMQYRQHYRHENIARPPQVRLASLRAAQRRR